MYTSITCQGESNRDKQEADQEQRTRVDTGKAGIQLRGRAPGFNSPAPLKINK